MEKKFHEIKLVLVIFLLTACIQSNDNVFFAPEGNSNSRKAQSNEKKTIIKDYTFKNLKTKKINDQALVLVENGKIKEAKKMFEDNLKNEPNSAITLNNLGLIAENEKKYEQAVNYFSKAIFYDSSYFPAYVNLISLHVNNDYLDRSLKILDYLETQKIDPETDLLKNYFFAYINLVKGNCELARKYISKTNNVNYFKQYEANIQTLKNSIDNCLLKKY